ncbi:putative dehydrogenase [Lipingzhangella halophila]|uniref:Putative dehydrogenase n=1 Tax=Lipingzhangella halophila TaxID=1783352 RepID=A0A7W7W5U4_9ACTN|nr:Gfo/Idh/MocA family oxidoreductase [Lipingzhangella halophila]MBB4935131.1 putative dehydrogenase [Lipingzhangella halophila]
MGSDHQLLLVGAGSRVQDVLLPTLKKAALPVRLIGAVDPDPGVAESLARFEPMPVYPSLEKALGTATFDTAILACPHDRHQSLTLRLLEAGVTVWKEKPLALTTRDAVELARRNGRLRVLAHRPHSQLYAIASRLAADWGRILSYQIRISRPTGDYTATWRAARTRAGGGALLDLGYHAFDLIARLVPAEVTSVYVLIDASPLWRPRVEVEESAQVLLTHHGGATGSVYVSRCDDRADVYDLVYEGGRITITNDRARIRVGEHPHLTHTVHLHAEEDAWTRMLRHHAQTRFDATVDMAEARVGVLATALTETAYTCLDSGQPERPPRPDIARPVERIA